MCIYTYVSVHFYIYVAINKHHILQNLKMSPPNPPPPGNGRLASLISRKRSKRPGSNMERVIYHSITGLPIGLYVDSHYGCQKILLWGARNMYGCYSNCLVRYNREESEFRQIQSHSWSGNLDGVCTCYVDYGRTGWLYTDAEEDELERFKTCIFMGHHSLVKDRYSVQDYVDLLCGCPDVSYFGATGNQFMTIFCLKQATGTLSTNIPHTTYDYVRAMLLLSTTKLNLC
jgi:hypothetical protein